MDALQKKAFHELRIEKSELRRVGKRLERYWGLRPR